MARDKLLNVVKRFNLREEESHRLVYFYIHLNIYESYYKALNRVK
jgi:hypothetical protein